MIALLVLDAARTCLDRPQDPPHYICRAPRGHSGPHEYVPVDMVIVADQADSDPALEQPLAD